MLDGKRRNMIPLIWSQSRMGQRWSAVILLSRRRQKTTRDDAGRRQPVTKEAPEILNNQIEKREISLFVIGN